AELVALERGDCALVEVIPRVECAVADEFECRAVQLIGAGTGNDADLRAIALAIGSAIRVGCYVEFAYRVDAEQLAAGAAGRDVDERCAGVLNTIQQEEIVLRAGASAGGRVS